MKKLDLPVYLVSLKQDAARRRILSENFPSYYHDFICVEAVDGRTLPASEYYSKTLPFFSVHRRPMTPAELGCTLSHIKALKSFLESNESFALIIEDDVIGRDEDLLRVSKSVSQLSSCSLVFCGCQDGLMNKYKYGYKISAHVLRVPRYNFGNFSRTAAYVVSRSAAKVILNFYENKYITVADFWFELLEGGDVDVFYIAGMRHPLSLGGSILEEERAVHHRTVVRKVFSKKMPRLVFNRFLEESKRIFNLAKGAIKIGVIL
ncbi:glycosyltransferase family 25 protein [Pseudomonas sp. 5Ae-yellow]|mgnify:CR=1 FL=1|uniref:glycosyltransferase family 25 protein n=1 Tax=Pseudomonas sp. 5Ae-yellow TaxID=2759848 RepID=UPI0015F38A89|nr:glycosyltransferase family 25 protein [Pseudomonas sp. 5Ae-yellow]MBA6420853.1 glycosyltransferase family 25 protein [Pseudomonas sp. 5Ae-yellow]